MNGWKWLIPLLLFFCGTGFCLIVWFSGHWLVRSDDFENISWAVVLDGESRECERTDATAKLYTEGKIDSIILSGVRIFKSRYTSEFRKPLLIAQGVPQEQIFELHNNSYSTIEEAALIIPQLRLLGVDTVLIITANYHSARSRMIYHKMAGGNPVIHVYASPFHHFNPNNWWSSRNSIKTYVLEMTKYFQSWVEMNLRENPDPRQKASWLLLEPAQELMPRISPEFISDSLNLEHPFQPQDTSEISPDSSKVFSHDSVPDLDSLTVNTEAPAENKTTQTDAFE